MTKHDGEFCGCAECRALHDDAAMLAAVQIEVFNRLPDDRARTVALIGELAFAIVRLRVLDPQLRAFFTANARCIAEEILAHATLGNSAATQPPPKTRA